jgi:hypothetical protein
MAAFSSAVRPFDFPESLVAGLIACHPLRRAPTPSRGTPRGFMAARASPSAPYWTAMSRASLDAKVFVIVSTVPAGVSFRSTAAVTSGPCPSTMKVYTRRVTGLTSRYLPTKTIEDPSGCFCR